MKNRLTALAISVIMICMCAVSCSEKPANLHTFEARIGEEPFKATYLTDKSDGTVFTEAEIAEIDSALSTTLGESTKVFSGFNSEGIYSVNERVDAVLKCSEDVISLIEYTYSLTELTKGAYQPVMGAVTDIYFSDGVTEITDEMLAESLTHTGNQLITVDGNNVYKADREAKFDLDSILEGVVIRDAGAVLASKNVTYAVINFKESTATFGSLAEDEPLDMAVQLSGDTETHSGILSFNDMTVTVHDADSFVVDNETGKKKVSEFDTVIVMSRDAILSSIIADIVYGMSADEIIKLHNEGYLDFEAVMIYADGEFVKTSEEIVYEKTVNE